MARLLQPALSVVVLASAVGLACGGGRTSERAACPSAAPLASASPDPRPVSSSSESYAPVFDELASLVETHHVFAEGRRAFWGAHKEELRREMAAATSREAGLTALRHLQIALGDRHCNLRAPTDLSPRRLKLGIDVHAAIAAGKPVVRIAKVSDPALTPALAVGDVVAAIDGVATEDWLARHPFESNALNRSAALQETAESAVGQVVPWTSVKENDTRVVRFVRAGAAFDQSMTFRRPFRYEKEVDRVGVDDAPDMAKIGCDQDAPPYAGYALDTVGTNLCVYRSTGARSSKPVIVRFLSFMYDLDGGDEDAQLRAVKVDHDLLARALARDSRVILDLHENHGGFNPFIFVSWFARGQWGHETVHVRVGEGFAEDDVRSFLWSDDARVREYVAAREAKRPEMTYPFLCKSKGSCDAVGPRRSELVTTAPVAIITGAECTSSCDVFSALWSTFRLGPIVGKQPMHGFTTVRHSVPVTAPDKRDMGRFSVALSWEGFAGHPPLEGRPISLDWEAPETFETRTSWLDDAVKEAARLLATAR